LIRDANIAMAQVLTTPIETSPFQQELKFGPQYVHEPLFIQSAPWETQGPVKKALSDQAKPYRPGAMLSESACVAPTFGQQFGNAPFGDMMCATVTGTSSEANDPEAESDCSTTDTTHEALSALVAGDGSSFGSPLGSPNPYMMPHMGMVADTPWSGYPDPSYWTAYQPEQTTWPQMLSTGSEQHRLGRCKPCAFMYKDGCRSGPQCPYCHLCPPGEKQRRKRVLRAMQRNMGPPGLLA